MEIRRMVLGSLANNTYILIGGDEQSTVIVDPSAEAERILEYLSGQGLLLKAILITHGHFDHIGAVSDLVRHTAASVYSHKEELKMMKDPIHNLSMYFTSTHIIAEGFEEVRDKDHLDFGADLQFMAIVVSGHSPKSICYYNKEHGVLFTGDTLFAGSIGRTDYYDGNSRDLITNIKERLLFLPASTKVYPGHGDTTTIGNEKQYNPYLS